MNFFFLGGGGGSVVFLTLIGIIKIILNTSISANSQLSANHSIFYLDKLYIIPYQSSNPYVTNLNQLQSLFITLDFLTLDLKIKILTLKI